MSTEAANVQGMALRARILANELFRTDATPILSCTWKVGPTCIDREEDRPLTRQEKAKGMNRRGFADYDTSKMCRGCEAYYHAERAAQLLHESHRWAVRIEAEEQRKTAAQ